MLKSWLRYNLALVFSHVKWIGNRVANDLVIEGVGKGILFHGEVHDNKIDGPL